MMSSRYHLYYLIARFSISLLLKSSLVLFALCILFCSYFCLCHTQSPDPPRASASHQTSLRGFNPRNIFHWTVIAYSSVPLVRKENKCQPLKAPDEPQSRSCHHDLLRYVLLVLGADSSDSTFGEVSGRSLVRTREKNQRCNLDCNNDSYNAGIIFNNSCSVIVIRKCLHFSDGNNKKQQKWSISWIVFHDSDNNILCLETASRDTSSDCVRNTSSQVWFRHPKLSLLDRFGSKSVRNRRFRTSDGPSHGMNSVNRVQNRLQKVSISHILWSVHFFSKKTQKVGDRFSQCVHPEWRMLFGAFLRDSGCYCVKCAHFLVRYVVTQMTQFSK